MFSLDVDKEVSAQALRCAIKHHMLTKHLTESGIFVGNPNREMLPNRKLFEILKGMLGEDNNEGPSSMIYHLKKSREIKGLEQIEGLTDAQVAAILHDVLRVANRTVDHDANDISGNVTILCFLKPH